MNLIEVNTMSQEQFIDRFGGVFEHSAWVAEMTWTKRPFSSRGELHEAMMDIVRASSEESIIRLFRSHPDLATRIRIGEYSTKEQQGVGLDRLSEEEFEQFAKLNHVYTDKFKFPFILAVKGKDKTNILKAMEERVHHSLEREAAQAMQEIGKITGFRLVELVTD